MVASIATCSCGRSICCQRALDDAVAFLVGVDQQVIVDGIRGDSHIGQDWRRRARRRTSPMAATAACPRGRAGNPLAAKARIKTGGLRSLTFVVTWPGGRRHARAWCSVASYGWFDGLLLEATSAAARSSIGWSANPDPLLPRANEHVVEERCDLARIAVAHAIYFDVSARPARFVQARDPRRHPFEQFRLACDDQNGVLSADRLQLDEILTEAALPRVDDPIEFSNDRLRRAVADRIDANRLTRSSNRHRNLAPSGWRRGGRRCFLG